MDMNSDTSFSLNVDSNFDSNSIDLLDEGDKLQKSRERNREHARKTRLRKKAQLETLKKKLSELQNEAKKLSMIMEESNTANILLCMSSMTAPNKADGSNMIEEDLLKGNLVDYIRNTVRAEAIKERGSKLSDKDNSFDSDNCSESENFDDSSEKHKDDSNLEGLRKERNRMHAKLTRDRKKKFTNKIQQMIDSLERQNEFMRNRIKNLDQSSDLKTINYQSI